MPDHNSQYSQKVAFVSGASRGLGRALLNSLLERGIKKVYGTSTSGKLWQTDDARIVPIQLDLADQSSIQKAFEQAPDVDVLVNNAGVNDFTNLLDPEQADGTREMATNYFGSLQMMRLFSGPMKQKQSGLILNINSICAFASMPSLSGYCASKAALHSITQGFRTKLREHNIVVAGAYPGPMETDMNEGIEIPDIADPSMVAATILDSITVGEHTIFPDSESQKIQQTLGDGPELLATEFAQY